MILLSKLNQKSLMIAVICEIENFLECLSDGHKKP